jgi:stage III sporulation protein AD
VIFLAFEMDSTTFKICGVAIAIGLSILLMRHINKDYENALSLCGYILLVGSALAMAEGLFEYIVEMMDASPLSGDIALTLMRVLGIVMLTKISGDILRDMGACGVAGGLEYVGKIEIVILTLPLVSSALDIVRGLISEAGF